MKKTIAALAIATALGFVAAPTAFAQPTSSSHSGAFVKGQVGFANLDHGVYDSTKAGYQLTVGYDWAVSDSFLAGVEGGYNWMGSFNPKNTYRQAYGVNDKAKLHGWTLGVNGRYSINQNWFVGAHGGLYHWNGKGLQLVDDATTGGLTPVHFSRSKTNWYAGAGVGYQFDNGYSLGLDYDYYRDKKQGANLSMGVVSLGVVYRF